MSEYSKFINAKYKLDENEIDFILLLIKNIDNNSQQFIINIDSLEKQEHLIKKLIKKNFELLDDDGYILLNWFNKIEYKKSSALIKIELQKDVKSFLLSIKDDFLNDDLRTFFSLSNNYSRAIYKLLKNYQNKEKININLENLMDSLKVPKSLWTYADFKRKVLNTAYKDLQNTDISFTIEEQTKWKKVIRLVFNIYTTDEFKKSNISEITVSKEKNLFTNSVTEIEDVEVIEETTKEIEIKKTKKELDVFKEDNYNQEIKRIVSYFDQERKKLQPNYVRRESGYNVSAEYLLRMHLKETSRTPQMFFDAIRWLFSNNPKASFHRQYIMNIGKLIEHYNTLEHQAMYSEEAVKFSEEAQVWYNIYKKQGLSDEDILQKLKEGGYIK